MSRPSALATRSRREFLIQSGLAGAAFAFPIPIGEPEEQVLRPTLWLAVYPDGRIVMSAAKLEMGQGILTALRVLVAEELAVDPTSIQVRFPSTDELPAHGDALGTTSSRSVTKSWRPVRVGAASVREMLVAAAARSWAVPSIECRAEKATVTHVPSGRQRSYGELASAAAREKVPESPRPKQRGPFRYIGKPAPRIEAPEVVRGRLRYGCDERREGMLFAVLARPPLRGGVLPKFDPAPALALPGVRHVVRIDESVAVVGETTWDAIRGRDALTLPLERRGGCGLHVRRLRAAPAPGPGRARRRELRPGAEGAAGRRHTGDRHQAAVARVRGAGAHGRVRDALPGAPADGAAERPRPDPGRQARGVVRHAASGRGRAGSRAPPRHLACGRRRAPYAHGRRLRAARGARLRGRGAARGPDDRRRPGAGVLDTRGRPAPRLLSPRHPAPAGGPPRGRSAALLAPSRCGTLDREALGLEAGAAPPHRPGRDRGSLEPALRHPGAARRVRGPAAARSFPGSGAASRACRTSSPSRASSTSWPTPPASDPLEFRLSHLGDSVVAPMDISGPFPLRRLRGVFELAAARAGWGSPLPPGRGRGVAGLVFDGRTACACVAEVAVEKGQLRLERIVCAIDCGIVVNPLGLAGNAESAIAWGASALFTEVTFAGGHRGADESRSTTRSSGCRRCLRSRCTACRARSGPRGAERFPCRSWRRPCATPSSTRPAAGCGVCRSGRRISRERGDGEAKLQGAGQRRVAERRGR